MTYHNKLKNHTLIGAVALISFFAPASYAQIPMFPRDYVDDNANLVRINTGGQPFYRNGRAYYYTQTHIAPAPVANDYVFSNNRRLDERRFCPPGQYKKGHCQKNWKRKYKHKNHGGYNNHDNRREDSHGRDDRRD